MTEKFLKYLLAVKTILKLSPSGTIFEIFSVIWLFFQVRKYSAQNILKLKMLFYLVKTADFLGIAGDIVECGVYNGGSAAVMAFASRCQSGQKKLWLFDSFEGLPRPSEKDGKWATEYFKTGSLFKGDVSKVREILEKLNIQRSRIHIIEGWFEETFRLVEIPRIAILHIDADWYRSVSLSLNKFYGRVEPGGFVVIDDYGSLAGCKRATDEFVKRQKLKIKLIRVEPTSAYYFQKPN